MLQAGHRPRTKRRPLFPGPSPVAIIRRRLASVYWWTSLPCLDVLGVWRFPQPNWHSSVHQGFVLTTLRFEDWQTSTNYHICLHTSLERLLQITRFIYWLRLTFIYALQMFFHNFIQGFRKLSARQHINPFHLTVAQFGGRQLLETQGYKKLFDFGWWQHGPCLKLISEPHNLSISWF